MGHWPIRQNRLTDSLPEWQKRGVKLQAYLDQSGVSKDELAEQLGVHPITIYKYVRGDRVPEPGVMVKIAEITKGQVTPNDFYDIPDAKRGRRRA